MNDFLPLSVTSDYARDSGCPEPCLRRIAEAAFTHVHWCHQWNTDFIYHDSEINQIRQWFRQYRLTMCDIHASAGVEKRWGSPVQYERLAGVELVKNRIDMAARLDCDVIIMHIDIAPEEPAENEAFWSRMRRSLDALEPHARKNGVRIALENGHFGTIQHALDLYDPAFLGLCYDSGHGNLVPDGLDQLESLKHRLISVHLHDNDGRKDWHRLVFSGTIDWPRLVSILAASSYKKCPSMELNMRNCGYEDEQAFLAEAFRLGQQLAQSLENARGAHN